MNQVEIRVKHLPEDFIVRESAAVRLASNGLGGWRLLLLRKRGYTTFEAVRWIATSCGIDEHHVGYCGLKDEDGLTEQLISLPSDAPNPQGIREDVDGRWMKFVPYGTCSDPLGIGMLEGNSFRITLRNLLPSQVELGPLSNRSIQHYFLNYFDVQRFGVPGGQKNTHRIGEALLTRQWRKARELLASSGAAESEAARSWTQNDEEFFAGLDKRVTSFYCAAFSSFIWNGELARKVQKRISDFRQIEVEGIPFTYMPEPTDGLRILGANHVMPIERYSLENGVERRTSTRATVVQTAIKVANRTSDECFPGRMKVELSFFLPSGSYATAALRQLCIPICDVAEAC